MSVGLRFAESMVGRWTPRGETGDRPFRFDIVVQTPSLLRPLGTVVGTLHGSLTADGLASGQPIEGTLEISPVAQRRLRYTFETTGDDGRRYRFDGWKTIRASRLLRSWTTLPGTVYDDAGEVVGTAWLRFPLRETVSFLAGFRVAGDDAALEAMRWDGTPGRLEVWYDTLTDPVTGTGVWLHHELVAPVDGPAFGHGWVALFPPDEQPVWARFGPDPIGPDRRGFQAGDVLAEHGRRVAALDGAAWDLTCRDGGPPLYTFPRAAWRAELLPAAQVVASPTASFTGTVRVGDRTVVLRDAPGGAARIYGHGNAERWGWLHADLGGGDVLEVVAAVSRRPGLNRLPPAPFVQLRIAGVDWPRLPLAAAPTGAAHLDLPAWHVTVRSGGRRLRADVVQPADRCLAVPYRDPDGASATCTNTERADAEIVLERRSAGRWVVERRWTLDGTAHAEIGSRP